MDIYSGNDDQIVPIMSLGGKGVISVLSNVAPKVAHDIAVINIGKNRVWILSVIDNIYSRNNFCVFVSGNNSCDNLTPRSN